MKGNRMDNFNLDAVNEGLTKVASFSGNITDIANKIADSVCEELDWYMGVIDDMLENTPSDKIPDYMLEEYLLSLTSMLYFVSDKQEDLGVKDDVAKLIYKEMYNTQREMAQGTIQDKDMKAEMASQSESLVSVIYSRAYKKVKLRVESGNEMIVTLKKVISRRMAEMDLSRTDRGASRDE